MLREVLYMCSCKLKFTRAIAFSPQRTVWLACKCPGKIEAHGRIEADLHQMWARMCDGTKNYAGSRHAMLPTLMKSAGISGMLFV